MVLNTVEERDAAMMDKERPLRISTESKSLDFERSITKTLGDCAVIKGRDIYDTWKLERNYIKSDMDYIALFKPIEEKTLEVETILPVETAELDLEDISSLLKWVRDYEVPISVRDACYNQECRFGSNGSEIYRLISVEECKERLSEIKIAVRLLQGVGKPDNSVIWGTITLGKNEPVRCVPPLKCAYIENKLYDWQSLGGQPNPKRSESEGGYGEYSEYAQYIASCVLIDLINRGLFLYPIPTQVRFVHASSGRVPAIKFAEYPRCSNQSFMSFIWETIKKRLCEKKGPMWRYKRCAKCNKWIEIRPPKNRETREDCPKCKVAKKRLSSDATKQDKRLKGLGIET